MTNQDLWAKMSKLDTQKAQILTSIMSFAPSEKQAPDYLIEAYKEEKLKVKK